MVSIVEKISACCCVKRFCFCVFKGLNHDNFDGALPYPSKHNDIDKTLKKWYSNDVVFLVVLVTNLRRRICDTV